MKKLLFSIFAFIVFATSGYCDGLGYINDSGSTYDVLNSEVSYSAVHKAFSDLGCACGDMPTEHKDEMARAIADSTKGHFSNRQKGLTLIAIFSICDGVLRYEDGYGMFCQKCISCIVEHHNNMVKEQQISEWKKGKIFTSEQEYNDTLRAKGKCEESVLDPGKGNTGIMFSSTVRTRKECEKHCRNVAIKSACYIDATFFEYDKEEKTYGCTCNTIGGDWYDFYIEGIDVKKDYFFVPTWEDYKKLYNMK